MSYDIAVNRCYFSEKLFVFSVNWGSKCFITKMKFVLHWLKRGCHVLKHLDNILSLPSELLEQNSIAEEIKSRLRSGNACYHSVQNLLSSRLLSKNLKIKIYRTIILPVVLHGCETWSLTRR